MFLSVPWYETEDDFKTILTLVPFEESQSFIPYPKWTKWVETLEEEQKQKGYIPYRVNIKAAAIKAWCEANDTIICRKSISEYALWKMASERGTKNP
jgi:hypothetical protein